MNEKTPLTQTPEQNNRLTRRRMVAALGGGLLALSGVGRGMEALAQEDERPGKPFPTPDATPTEVESTEYADEVDISWGSAELLVKDIDTMTPSEFASLFNMTVENSPTIDAQAATLANQGRKWVTAGCTPEEVEPFLASGDISGFQSAMISKYGTLAAAGLSGHEDVENLDEGVVIESHLYKTFTPLHEMVLGQYFTAVRDGTVDEIAFTITPTHYEQTSQDVQEGVGGTFGVAIDLEAALQGGADPTTLSGSMAVEIQHSFSSKVLKVSLDENDTVLFSEAE